MTCPRSFRRVLTVVTLVMAAAAVVLAAALPVPPGEWVVRVELLDSRPWFAAFQPMDKPMQL